MPRCIASSQISGVPTTLNSAVKRTLCDFVVIPYGNIEMPMLKCAAYAEMCKEAMLHLWCSLFGQ